MPGYLGDKEKMIVHHLAYMSPKCNVYKIKILQRQYFTPDSKITAVSLGFQLCPFCKK